MHNSMMNPDELDHDHDHNHDQIHENGYGGNDGWVDINHYNSPQHQSPIFEQGGFGFMQQHPGQHGNPIEPTFNSQPILHPLQPTTSHQPLPLLQPMNSHQQLQPLLQPLIINSSHSTWPSELTNPSYASAQVVMPALPTQLKGRGKKLAAGHRVTPSPRKTLTDADRRRMCEYHAKFPQEKQSVMGEMFGVERSTVSKVLRQKEKYLYPEDQTMSPVKRAKGKHPDIDRALANWASKQPDRGAHLTDSEIRHQASIFGMHDGGRHSKVISASFIEKFRRNNNIPKAKMTRRASETNLPNHGSRKLHSSNEESAAHTSNDISPISPNLLTSPSPLSSSKSDDEIKSEGANGYFSLNTENNRYKHSNSQSTTSFSSPTTPFSFSPPQNSQPWPSSIHGRHLPPNNAFQRPRSQTFPMLGIDPSFISTQNNEPLTPKYNLPVTAPPSALDSPIHEMAPPFGMDSAISSPHLHHSSSNGSMGPPSSAMPITGLQSPPGSTAPSSPTQEDACKALDTLISFIQQAPNSLVEQNEYLTILSLTEKLRIHQSLNGTLPGGLHRIAEQDCEVAPKMEHSMSTEC